MNNNTRLLNNSQIAFNVWIARDTNFLIKSIMESTFTFAPEILKIDVETYGDFKIDFISTEMMLFDEFNEPMNIVLPEGAEKERKITVSVANNNSSAS